jgi:hypothetical protein
MLEPETQRFVDGLIARGGPPLRTLSLQDARKVLSDLQAGSLPKPPAEIEDRTIPGGPTGSVRMRIVRPKASDRLCQLCSISTAAAGCWATAIPRPGRAANRHVAERLAKEFRDGVAYLDLSPVSDPRFLVSLLASALGHATRADDPIRELAAFFQDRRMLIVLDSCEHMIDAARRRTRPRTSRGSTCPLFLHGAKIVTGATLKIYKGGDHGICTTRKDEVNEDLLAFLRS